MEFQAKIVGKKPRARVAIVGVAVVLIIGGALCAKGDLSQVADIEFVVEGCNMCSN